LFLPGLREYTAEEASGQSAAAAAALAVAVALAAPSAVAARCGLEGRPAAASAGDIYPPARKMADSFFFALFSSEVTAHRAMGTSCGNCKAGRQAGKQAHSNS
jgi:hypothetical protein